MLEALQSRRMKLRIEEVSEKVLEAVNRHQVDFEAIITTISRKQSGLKNLNISVNNLSRLDAGLLARAVTALEKVDLHVTQLTGQQLEAIMAVLGMGDSRLKELNIDSCNLSDLDPGLVARAVAW